MEDEFGLWASGPPTDPGLGPISPLSRRPRRWPWLVATPLAVVIVGAGTFVALRSLDQARSSTRRGAPGSGAETILATPVGKGFLATTTTSVAFVQWTDVDGSLSGSAQIVNTEGEPPNETTRSSTVRITGRISGTALSVSFGGTPAVFGTVSTRGFTLDVPEPDGTLAPLRFEEADASAFDAAVRSLEQAVAGANTVAQHLAALQRLENELNAAASAVTSDLAALPSDEQALSADLKAISADLATEASDLARTKDDEQTVVAEAHQQPGDNSQVCADAQGVTGDAAQVANDAQAVASDAQNIQADLNALRAELARLDSDLENLGGVEAKLPGTVPPSAPSPGEVSQAQAVAKAAIEHALSATRADIDQANAFVAAAFADAAAADQAGNCGPGPEAPSPIPQVQ